MLMALLSCVPNNSTESQQISSDSNSKYSNNGSEIQNDTDSNGKRQYSNIMRIYERLDTVFIDADYIQFLTGDAAIDAAKKANEADSFETADGKIVFAVPNDYFIINESKRIRQLPLAKDCTYDLLNNPDRLHPIEDNSLKSLMKIYGDSPFILTLNDKGVVINIKEVFLP